MLFCVFQIFLFNGGEEGGGGGGYYKKILYIFHDAKRRDEERSPPPLGSGLFLNLFFPPPISWYRRNLGHVSLLAISPCEIWRIHILSRIHRYFFSSNDKRGREYLNIRIPFDDVVRFNDDSIINVRLIDPTISPRNYLVPSITPPIRNKLIVEIFSKEKRSNDKRRKPRAEV